MYRTSRHTKRYIVELLESSGVSKYYEKSTNIIFFNLFERDQKTTDCFSAAKKHPYPKPS